MLKNITEHVIANLKFNSNSYNTADTITSVVKATVNISINLANSSTNSANVTSLLHVFGTSSLISSTGSFVFKHCVEMES
jgi:hypothetical protein